MASGEAVYPGRRSTESLLVLRREWHVEADPIGGLFDAILDGQAEQGVVAFQQCLATRLVGDVWLVRRGPHTLCICCERKNVAAFRISR